MNQEALQIIFDGLLSDLDDELGPEFLFNDNWTKDRLWEAVRAASGLYTFGRLVELAEKLSAAVIANEVQPGPGLSHQVWELALRIREELQLVDKPQGLRPLEFHYTMRDALWTTE